MYKPYALLSMLVFLFGVISISGCYPVNKKERAVTFLHINDVYRIEGVDSGSVGGIARLRTLRQRLQKKDPNLIVMHAGDMLFPSSLSQAFDGEQMIDMLNGMDGDSTAFDSNMFAVFGNHEFDKEQLQDATILNKAVDKSQFYWLNTNVSFLTNADGSSIANGKHVISSRLHEVNGIKLGIFGITTNIKIPAYASIDADYIAVAKRATNMLRQQGAEVVVALTHLPISQDVEILQLGNEGPDLILGGHEHNKQSQQIKGRYVIKADADARTASVVRVSIDQANNKAVDFHFEELNEKIIPDPTLQAQTDVWLQRYDQFRCHMLDEMSGCLARPLGKTAVTLLGEEKELRRFETNLGDWLADQALNAFKGEGAQVAFINSGGLRLNQNIPADTIITARHIEEMFPYNSDLTLLKINGAILQQVIEHSIEDWSGKGGWLQIAGFAFEHNPDKQTASRLSLLTPDGPRLIKPDDEIVAVVSRFLVNPKKGQDGYVFLSRDQEIKYANAPISLRILMEQALKESGVIQPMVEGRICNTNRSGPCLLSNGVGQ